jgi:hypothetical protein
MPTSETEAAHGAEGPPKEPIKRLMAAPTEEGFTAMFEAIKGRKITEAEAQELREAMIKYPLPPPTASLSR